MLSIELVKAYSTKLLRAAADYKDAPNTKAAHETGQELYNLAKAANADSKIFEHPDLVDDYQMGGLRARLFSAYDEFARIKAVIARDGDGITAGTRHGRLGELDGEINYVEVLLMNLEKERL